MCPSSSDPNKDKRPGDPWIYKPLRVLEPSDELCKQLLQCGLNGLTYDEAAAVLNVHPRTLEHHFEVDEDALHAYQRGRALRRVKMRKQGDMHALLDPPTWRFLSKNELGLADDPSKARLDQETTKALKGISKEEVIRRIEELKPKLIGSYPREAAPQEQPQAGDAAGSAKPQSQGARPLPDGAVVAAPGAGAAQGGQVLEGGAPGPADPARADRHAPLQPEPRLSSSPSQLAQVQKRLAEIEASMVRKQPKADTPANRGQMKAVPHAPGRLPGRIGSK